MRKIAAAAIAVAIATSAHAAGPLGKGPPIAGDRTKVLTLGTFHLGEVANFDPNWLALLLDKLQAYHPDVITVEAVSGEQCATMKANPPRDPAKPVLTAGEPERLARAERLARGIPVDPGTWAGFVAAAKSVGVALPAAPG